VTHRGVAGGLAPILLSCVAAASLAAQDTSQVLTDTLAPVQDSLRRDSVIAFAPPSIPVPEAEVPLGPLPPGTRHTFTRDSLMWARSMTLADLLGRIPGVYVVKAGFVGQPEFITYAGRAGAAIELYWDGMPLPPVGPDSLFHDLARINLSYLERVDVEVLPAALRVFVVSERHDGLQPWTYLRVMRGDYNTAAYAGIFQKRWPSGLGLNLAADFVGSDGASGSNRGDQTFDVWARLEWLPTPRSGASYQVRRQRHDRDPVGSPAQVAGRLGSRTDYILAFFAGTRDDGLGLRADGLIGSSTWSSDSLTPEVPDQTVRQARLRLRYRRPSWSTELSGRIGETRITSEIAGRVGWIPFPGVVVSGDARWQRHENDRTSLAAYGTLGLFWGPLSVTGGIQYSDAVQAPALATDSAQQTLDGLIRAGIETVPISGHVALVRRDAFLPLPFPDLPVIPAFDTTAAATYLESDVMIRTSRALSFEAWYSAPVSGGRSDLQPGSPRQAADLQPPNHARAQITYQSKFWRAFRSGSFDFKIQIAMESWSGGSAGLDESGLPITLVGATFYEAFVQVELSQFRLFWNFRNAYNSPDPYVPGLSYPPSVQTFGVKWEFVN
jgi:hypothetical protein